MSGVLDILERLAEQQAAISDAQRALHRLAELGLGEIGPRSAHIGHQRPMPDPGLTLPADSASPATLQRAGSGRAKKRLVCRAPDCGRKFTPKGRQTYCSVRCRSRTNMHLARDRAAARETSAICEQNAAEGYDNLSWGTGNGAA